MKAAISKSMMFLLSRKTIKGLNDALFLLTWHSPATAMKGSIPVSLHETFKNIDPPSYC